MVNNFERIKGLLDFSSPLDFYYITILLRKADVPDSTKSVKVVDQYCIYSLEDLDKKKETIIKDCEDNNARAYIYVNKRNTEQVALESIRLTTEYVIAKDYKAVRSAYWKAVGRKPSQGDKRWIVDIDTKDSTEVWRITHKIRTLHRLAHAPSVIWLLPTVSGYHAICRPFNVSEFRLDYANVDIHKDNPTVLYANIK